MAEAGNEPRHPKSWASALTIPPFQTLHSLVSLPDNPTFSHSVPLHSPTDPSLPSLEASLFCLLLQRLPVLHLFQYPSVSQISMPLSVPLSAIQHHPSPFLYLSYISIPSLQLPPSFCYSQIPSPQVPSQASASSPQFSLQVSPKYLAPSPGLCSFSPRLLYLVPVPSSAQDSPILLSSPSSQSCPVAIPRSLLPKVPICT